MAVFSYHFQKSPQGWPLSYAKLSGGMGKFLFDLERLREAKATNPKVKTWYRWVGHQPLPTSNYEQHARDWLNQFIDGTFRREAQHVDYIQEYNETLAASQSPEERARWIALHTAMARVWHDEYRQEEALSHIRMILCETAIGNDIPWQIAAAAQKYDAALGYHPYIVCRVGSRVMGSPDMLMELTNSSMKIRHDGPRASFRERGTLYRMQETVVDKHSTMSLAPSEGEKVAISRPDYVSPHDFEWYSGRWATMDAEYKARGITVDWAFGEAGPVRDASQNWSGHLDPQGGWKHKECLDGDMNKYVEVMRYWLDNATQTPAYHEGRLLGQQLFTSGAPGSGPDWGSFDIVGDNMDRVAQFSNEYNYPPIGTPPPPPPPPPPPEPECKGLPRVQYHRTSWVLPQDITRDRALDIMSLAYDKRISIIYSYDDAGVGALDENTAVLWGIADKDHQLYSDWYATHYPGTEVLFQALPQITLDVPLKSWVVTQRYGDNYDKYMEKWGIPGHNGIDFGVDVGTPVYAARGGTVRLIANDPDGYGKYVRLAHEDGVETYYGHLTDIAQLGAVVAAGDVIGWSGNTGWSTGPHLHFGVKVNGVATDPEGYTGPVSPLG